MNPITLTLPTSPSRLTRLGLFTFLALPGAFLVGTCASLISYVTVNFADAALDCFIAIPLALGAALLLFGTRTTAEPLFLLVFVPMPILITLGFHLGYLGRDAGFPIAVLGMIWPALTYPPISRHYKRRATAIGLQVTSCKLQVEKAAPLRLEATGNFQPATCNVPPVPNL